MSVVKYLSVAALSLALLFISPAASAHRYNQHPSSNVVKIYWGKSVFYKHSNGIIYSRHYSRRTINDLVSICRHYGMRTYTVLPRGYVGAFPNYLNDYAYRRFHSANITLIPYGRSYRYQRYYYQPYYYQPNYYYQHRGYRHYRGGSGIYFHFRF